MIINTPPQNKPQEKVISSHAISLEKRFTDKFVNDVMKDNILLNIAYMAGKTNKDVDPKRDELRKPFHYNFVLKPNQTFAFHDDVLPKYQGKINKTTNAHFNLQENFRSDGYLAGDGVCHLASIIYWAAKDAGLDATAPTNHNFMAITQIPKEFGVSIYSYPGKNYTSQVQNLYITNNKNLAVKFKFDFDGENLKVSVATL